MNLPGRVQVGVRIWACADFMDKGLLCTCKIIDHQALYAPGGVCYRSFADNTDGDSLLWVMRIEDRRCRDASVTCREQTNCQINNIS